MLKSQRIRVIRYINDHNVDPEIACRVLGIRYRPMPEWEVIRWKQRHDVKMKELHASYIPDDESRALLDDDK